MYGGLPGLPSGPEGIRTLFHHFGNIAQLWEINDVVAEGNKVVIRATNTCVQDNFLGIPSYGRPQVFTAMFIHLVENGKLATTWRNANDLGRVLQLGASVQSSTSN
ncbi:MAG: ester cyclase [Ferruginibacter sp.]